MGVDLGRNTQQLNGADVQVLNQALNGRVYEKTQIEKKAYSVLNAFCLLLARLQMWKAMAENSARPPRMPPSAMSA